MAEAVSWLIISVGITQLGKLVTTMLHWFEWIENPFYFFAITPLRQVILFTYSLMISWFSI